MPDHDMTERNTLASIRRLSDYISAVLEQGITVTDANATLLKEVDCLLTGAVSLLSEATNRAGVSCSYTSCGRNYCSPMPSEGECLAQENGRVVGSCVVTTRPGVDTAVRGGTDEHMTKGASKSAM